MKLNVLICTFNDGIKQVPDIFLPYRKDVTYIVSHQYDDKSHDTTPHGLIRNDVIVLKLHGRGLSKNRNFALSHANGDIAIIADDDVRYCNEYFDRVIAHFEKYPVLDIGLFKIRTDFDEPPYKVYPENTFEWTSARQHSVSSIEITFRLSKIKNKIWFDERFGLGSMFLIGGEENAFLHDCKRAGLKINYFPEFIVEHPYESFNKHINKYDRRRIRTQAALDMRLEGYQSIIRSLFITMRRTSTMIKDGESPLHFFWNRLIGAWIILFHKKREEQS